MSSPAPTSPLSYPFEAPPAAGEVREVVAGVHWLRMPLPFALDHINLWLLEDGPGLVMVDCGLGDTVTREIWERALGEFVRGRRIHKVIVTHLHPDHAGNAGWFTRRFGASLWMSQGEYLMAHAWRDNAAGYTDEASLEFYREHGLNDAQREAMLLARGGRYRTFVPEFPTRYHRMSDGDRIAIGGREWRCLVGHGHAPEHIALYCAETGLMISGDMVLPRISTNISVHATQPDSDPLKLFLDSIGGYRDTLPRETLVLPSHGLVFRGLHERVAQLETHHRDRLAELEEACAEPRAAADVISTLFRRKLDGHAIWFAMGETVAHLNYLAIAGRLRRVESESGMIRFVKP